MPPEGRDAVCLWDMLQAARAATQYIEGMTLESFLAPEHMLVRRGVERELEIIGEAARRVSPSFREAHSDLPWKDMVGLRNVISHAYDRVDPGELYEIARNRVPMLITQLEAVMPPTPDASQ